MATGALSTILKSIRPVAVKARSMVGDLAQSLKGSRATGEQWYNQLKNKPGVRPAALEAAFGHLKDGRIQLTKDEFLKAVVNPKLSTQRAHARGVIQPGSEKRGTSLLIDEIQSDPYQALTSKYGATERAATPELKTPHGDMAKALLIQAAEGGANRLVIPSGPRIAELRGPKYLPAMQDIYDDQLFKQFYKPLDAMGIPMKENGGYRSIEIPPDVREGLTKSGLPFKNGGHVTQPSKHNNTFMCGGLNLINPKNKTKGPLNIQWNSNNLIASSRAK